MDRLASQLLEHETVMGITSVGKSMGPQLMVEIGNLRCFAHQKSLGEFAGTDPLKEQSGEKASQAATAARRPFARRCLSS